MTSEVEMLNGFISSTNQIMTTSMYQILPFKCAEQPGNHYQQINIWANPNKQNLKLGSFLYSKSYTEYEEQKIQFIPLN